MIGRRILLVCMWLAGLTVGGGCGKEQGGDDAVIAEIPTGTELSDDQMENLVLAWVGDEPLTVSDVRHHMLLTTGPNNIERYIKNPEIVRVALSALVDQYAWGKKAEKEGMELTPAERRQLESTRMELLATRYVADVLREEYRASPEQVEAFYNEHQERYLVPSRVAVRHIQVGTREEAEDIKRQIDGGADFVEMVEKYSQDTNTKDLGGALGYVSQNSKVLGIGHSDTFERAVLPMKVGEVGIAQSGMGWHVVKVEKKEGGGIQPLEEVYQDISNHLTESYFNTAYGERLIGAWDEAEASLLSDNIDALTGVVSSPLQLMQDAARTEDPQDKLILYQRVAFEFEDDPLAPEAMFRVAYTHYADARDVTLARKALKRLKRHWPDSDWSEAGDFLMAHLTDDPELVGTPEEILSRVQAKHSN